MHRPGCVVLFNRSDDAFIRIFKSCRLDLNDMYVAINNMDLASIARIHNVGYRSRCTLSKMIEATYHNNLNCVYLQVNTRIEQNERNAIFQSFTRDDAWLLAIVVTALDPGREAQNIQSIKSIIYHLAYRANQIVQLHTQWIHETNCLIVFTIGQSWSTFQPFIQPVCSEVSTQTE